MDYGLIFKIVIVLIAFIVIVRFLFSSKGDENEYKRSPEEIKKEIDNFRKDGKITNKEYGKLMDDMMEDYYQAEDKK